MNSMRLNVENPRNKPSKPPQIARKSAMEYNAKRCNITTCCSLNEIQTNANRFLKLIN